LLRKTFFINIIIKWFKKLKKLRKPIKRKLIKLRKIKLRKHRSKKLILMDR
jgi:hypothetical protein